MSPTRGTICFLSLQIGVVEIYLTPLTIPPWSTAGSRWRLAAWGGASHVHRAPSNRHPSGHNIFSECPDWNCWNLFDRPRVPLGACVRYSHANLVPTLILLLLLFRLFSRAAFRLQVLLDTLNHFGARAECALGMLKHKAWVTHGAQPMGCHLRGPT